MIGSGKIHAKTPIAVVGHSPVSLFFFRTSSFNIVLHDKIADELTIIYQLEQMEANKREFQSFKPFISSLFSVRFHLLRLYPVARLPIVEIV